MLLLTATLIINFSCVKRSDGDYDSAPNVNRSSINITFIDSLSGKYLYSKGDTFGEIAIIKN